MRKLLISVLTLGLLGATGIYLSSCAKQAGPMSPSISVLDQKNSLDKRLPHVSGTGTTMPAAPQAISKTVQVKFDTEMDSASFVKDSTVRLYTANDTTTGETLYSAYSLSYNATSKTLVLTPDNLAWTDARHYHLVLSTGIRSLQGNPLDGNSNNIAESETYDNYHNGFTLGTPTSTYAYSIGSVSLNSLDCNGTDLLSAANPYLGGLNFYNYVTITAVFSRTMDISNLMNSATSLVQTSVSLTDSSGAAVSPANITVTTTSNNNDTLVIELRMPASTVANPVKYQLVLRGGDNGIRTSAIATLVTPHYFDGNGVHDAEASDDTLTYTLGTMLSTGGLPRTYVTGVTKDGLSSSGGNRRFIVRFSVGSGIGTIDASTISSSTVQLIDSSTGQPIAPTAIEVNNANFEGGGLFPLVYIYLPVHYINAGAGNRSVIVFISKNVKSGEGVPMDDDGDGMTGMDTDNHSETETTVYNF